MTKIYQCLLHLLSNASKFTEAGEITLEVSRFRRKQEEGREKPEEKFSFLEEEEVESDVLGLEVKREGEKRKKESESDISGGEEWISFQVSDTGIGMNAEQIETVRDRTLTKKPGFSLSRSSVYDQIT